jgi:serine O-acetyltransferase
LIEAKPDSPEAATPNAQAAEPQAAPATAVQSASPPLSPCDAGWDAAPLKALLDKGAPASSSTTPGDSASDSAGFTAYAVDPGAGDPLVKVLHELINHAAAQDARIAQLCQTIEAMGSQVKGQTAPLDAQRLNKLVDE